MCNGDFDWVIVNVRKWNWSEYLDREAVAPCSIWTAFLCNARHNLLVLILSTCILCALYCDCVCEWCLWAVIASCVSPWGVKFEVCCEDSVVRGLWQYGADRGTSTEWESKVLEWAVVEFYDVVERCWTRFWAKRQSSERLARRRREWWSKRLKLADWATILVNVKVKRWSGK